MLLGGGEGERRSPQQVPGRVEEGREEGVELLEDKECAVKHSTVSSDGFLSLLVEWVVFAGSLSILTSVVLQ